MRFARVKLPVDRSNNVVFTYNNYLSGAHSQRADTIQYTIYPIVRRRAKDVYIYMLLPTANIPFHRRL